MLKLIEMLYFLTIVKKFMREVTWCLGFSLSAKAWS